MAVEAGDRGQRAALDLHDRDAQRRGVQDQRIEGGAPGGHDEQPPRLATCRERLFDRAAPGDELVAVAQQRSAVEGGWRCVVTGGSGAKRELGGRRPLGQRAARTAGDRPVGLRVGGRVDLPGGGYGRSEAGRGPGGRRSPGRGGPGVLGRSSQPGGRSPGLDR